MKVGIPKEIAAGETRVATTPDIAKKLIANGLEVIVERGAGEHLGELDRSGGEERVVQVVGVEDLAAVRREFRRRFRSDMCGQSASVTPCGRGGPEISGVHEYDMIRADIRLMQHPRTILGMNP